MLAATVFFLVQHGQVDKKFKDSMLVAALITGIAALHYYYMRNAAMEGDITTAYRYVDWILTVPLMCVEFYLILKPSGATKSMLWKLIGLSVVMLVTGYVGEAGLGDAVVWGTISGISYFVIVYILWFGSAGQLAQKAGGAVLDAFNALKWIVSIGWSIYPIGYIFGLLAPMIGLETININFLNITYNLADFINKILFGLIIWNVAYKDKALN